MTKKKKQRLETFGEDRDKIYKGKTVDELRKMDIREASKFMTSRSRRTLLRNADFVQKFVFSCEKKVARGKRIRTHKRDIIIVPKLIGYSIGVHNGKAFQEVPITTEMIGHRLGEFSPTRTKVTHSSAGIGATKGSRAKKK